MSEQSAVGASEVGRWAGCRTALEYGAVDGMMPTASIVGTCLRHRLFHGGGAARLASEVVGNLEWGARVGPDQIQRYTRGEFN